MGMPIYCFHKTFRLYYLDSVLPARWCFVPPVYTCLNAVALVQHAEATLTPRGSYSCVWHIVGFILRNPSCCISIRSLRAFVASESAQCSASWELKQAVWLSFTFQVHRIDFEWEKYICTKMTRCCWHRLVCGCVCMYVCAMRACVCVCVRVNPTKVYSLSYPWVGMGWIRLVGS